MFNGLLTQTANQPIMCRHLSRIYYSCASVSVKGTPNNKALQGHEVLTFGLLTFSWNVGDWQVLLPHNRGIVCLVTWHVAHQVVLTCESTAVSQRGGGHQHFTVFPGDQSALIADWKTLDGNQQLVAALKRDSNYKVITADQEISPFLSCKKIVHLHLNFTVSAGGQRSD